MPGNPPTLFSSNTLLPHLLTEEYALFNNQSIAYATGFSKNYCLKFSFNLTEAHDYLLIKIL